jgi:trans-2,3-dihydro-3-hydroxyanthranilate isomerase
MAGAYAPDVHSLRYDLVDVFCADGAYTGNPLAVVHGGSVLTTEQMQAIAAEFGLSETTFPLAPTTPDAAYRLRIFTPSKELPFAGHPSVGSAWVLAQTGLIGTGRVVQECGAGLLPVSVDSAGAQVGGGAPEFGPDLDGEELAAAVGLGPDDLVAAVPAGTAGAGVPFAFLPVRADAVARARPDAAAVQAATAGLTGITVVSFDRSAWSAHVRMFAPGVGVAEDPATGSAAVALGVFLTGRGMLPADGQTGITVRQGAEIGRPSELAVLVTARDGVAVGTSVWGRVAAVARGQLVAVPGPDPTG